MLMMQIQYNYFKKQRRERRKEGLNETHEMVEPHGYDLH
jgi:hypothetical protein